MARRQKIPLVITLLVSFVFSGYWQFLYWPKLQKAKATGPTTPPPPSTSVNFKALDQQYASIEASMDGGTHKYVFSSSVKITADNLETGIGTQSGIWAHQLTNPTGSICSFYNESATQSATSKVYLITARATATSALLQYGIALLMPGTNKYKIFSNGSTGCGSIGSLDLTVFANLISRSKAAAGARVMPSANIDNITSYCTSLAAEWSGFQESVRKVLIPPGAEGSLWERNYGTRPSDAVTWLNVGRFWLTMVISDSADEKYQAFYNAASDTTIDYDLNADGKQIYNTALSTADSIAAKIAALRAQYGDSWPSGCTPLKKFKINPALANSAPAYASLAEFAGDLDKVVEHFKQWTGTLDQPTTSASESDSCGNPGMKGVGIFAWMICGLGSLTHMIAQKLMTTAMKYLTISIGANIKLKQPSLSDDSTNQ